MISDHVNIDVELVSEGLSFPTSLALDKSGNVYLAESGLMFENRFSSGGRIQQITSDGSTLLLVDGLRAPVNGLAFHDNSLYISEGGYPGRITRFNLSNGELNTVLDNLPGLGNYHTNMVAFGPDNKIYFSQGAMTNSGIVGLDSYEVAWLRILPQTHDVPGYDVTLTGINVETIDPFNSCNSIINRNGNEEQGHTQTGVFVPFGTKTTPGQQISAELPCTAGIMRCNIDGTNLELVAWGLRNSYGLGFLPDGRLLAIDQGPDDRGSRPVGNAPDLLFEIHKGAWYGWPDFIGGDSITDVHYASDRGPPPTFVLANHKELPTPERPLLRFPSHSAAVKFDMMLSANVNDEWKDQIFVALFGDEKPMTALLNGPRVGRAVARIDSHDWSLHPFMTEPLVRPIDVRFNPLDEALYILDFGQFEIGRSFDILADKKSGKLWRTSFV
jgi:glucose/arabinose dehydrogenase